MSVERPEPDIEQSVQLVLENGFFYKITVNMTGVKDVASHREPHPIFGHYSATQSVDVDLRGDYAKYDKESDTLIITNPKVTAMELKRDG